jgi:hypothetical protein
MLRISIIALVLSTTAASAQYYGTNRGSSYGYGTGSNPSSTYVQPHINSNGSQTQGHYRTTPNNTQYDNYGTRGNYNPHTGSYGTRSPRY